MKRWCWIAILLAYPACRPFGQLDYSRPRATRYHENDRLGALPHRPLPPGTPPVRPVSRALAVETEVDEFTGSEVHSLEIDLGRTQTFTFFARTGIDVVGVLYSQLSDRWTFLECHHVHGLADDIRITPEDVDHDGDVGRRLLTEHVSFRLSSADLAAMSEATRVRFRICNTVFEFPPIAAAAFADLLGRIHPRETVIAPREDSSP